MVVWPTGMAPRSSGRTLPSKSDSTLLIGRTQRKLAAGIRIDFGQGNSCRIERISGGSTWAVGSPARSMTAK